MQTIAKTRRPVAEWISALSFEAKLGILFGIIMPVLSGLLFPTYIHHMPLKWQERARLLEVHFVASEILVIAWAYARGFDRDRLWATLSPDIRSALLVWLAAMFFSSAVLATQPVDALLQSLIQVVHLYFFAAVYHLARRDGRGEYRTFLTWLVAGLPVLIIYTLWRFNFPPPLSQIPGGRIEWDFALPGFINLRYLGTWVGAIAAAISVHVLYRAKFDRPGKIHLALLFVLCFMFWTATRSAVFGVLFALALAFVAAGRLPKWRNLVGSFTIAVAAFVISLLFAFNDPVFAFYNPGEMTSPDTFASGRLELWAATIARWQQSPWVGWGTGSIFFDVFIGWSHTQPHNAVLQALISWGVIGGGAALWLLGRALVAAARIVRAGCDEGLLPMLTMALCVVGMSMLDGALYYPRFIIAAIIPLALLLAHGKGSRPVEQY